jgi:hypothetical protein
MCWSNKQSLTARSSTEAEIIGLSEGLNHALWARNMLNDLGVGLREMAIYQDNESCLHIMNNGRNNGQRTKHLDVRFFHAMECVKNGEIKLIYLPTADMVADFFTKPLSGELFYKLRNKIVRRIVSEK